MKKALFFILKAILSVIILLIISVWAFVTFAPTFGDVATGESLEKIKNSKNFNGEIFVNLVETKLDTRDPQSGESMLSSMLRFFTGPADKTPLIPLPSQKFNASKMENGSFVWFGHSTILMKTNGVVILCDPVFNQASPIPGTVEPFEMEQENKLADLPEKIDIVLISHDHYDHLDYEAIPDLDSRVESFYVPLGLKAHLLKWGIIPDKIVEMDWYENTTQNGVSLTMTPSRHFSGRGLTNQFSTLWCSWVIKSPDLKVFFNGDSGYFDEFKTIGEKFGPFDIAFMENGAYDKDWAEIHMLPEESVQASLDLQSKIMFPIHWGKFDLANHVWDEPIIRASNEAKLKNVNIATPLIGEVFTLENIPTQKWWEMVRKMQKASN